MLKRALTFLFLCGLVSATALSAQQPPMLVLAPQSPPPSTAQHAAILAALRTGDGEAARASMTRHIENAGELLALHFASSQMVAWPD